MSQLGASTGLSGSAIVALVLLPVALSLGLMGIFYVVRRGRSRRRRQLQGDIQADCQAPSTKPAAETHANESDLGDGSGGTSLRRAPTMHHRPRSRRVKRIARRRHSRVEHLIDSDISNGHERFSLPAISYLAQDSTPVDFHYVTEHVQCEPNINIRSSLTGMVCCSCTGDCSSPECQCSTTSNSRKCYNSNGLLSSDYQLESPEVIRECNNACKCNPKRCKNKVIQGGSRARLVLFRTRSRGWGVRTLEHLARGTFVGVYSGELVSVSSSQTRQDDTYLFNLSAGATVQASDSETRCEPVAQAGAYDQGQMEQMDATERGDHEQQQVLQANRDDDQKAEEAPRSLANPTTGDHFVCDAKFYGNFTRFINHSCEPNVIGVRTFTVHQDDRFPYISFFARHDIPAGSELTLNYGDSYWLVKCKRDKVFCLCKKAGCKFSRKTLPLTMKQYSEKQR